MPQNKVFKEIANLATEQRNPASERIDIASTREILEIINYQDKSVADAVFKEIPNIEIAVDRIVDSFRKGGRLVYVGAGTSGRLGILDASECPPTFGTEPDMVQGIIAGGDRAVFIAQEGAEDKPEYGAEEIRVRNINPPDIVCGIAASGRTPFVKGALEESKKRGVFTILITTVPKEQIQKIGTVHDILISPNVGPEVITGSTRMKSGTAQKLILNMLTTASMVKLGKTLGNVMVDLQLTNEKLKERSHGILMSLCGIDYDRASFVLQECGGHVKTALVMEMADVSSEIAHKLLEESDGYVKKAISMHKSKNQ